MSDKKFEAKADMWSVVFITDEISSFAGDIKVAIESLTHLSACIRTPVGASEMIEGIVALLKVRENIAGSSAQAPAQVPTPVRTPASTYAHASADDSDSDSDSSLDDSDDSSDEIAYGTARVPPPAPAPVCVQEQKVFSEFRQSTQENWFDFDLESSAGSFEAKGANGKWSLTVSATKVTDLTGDGFVIVKALKNFQKFLFESRQKTFIGEVIKQIQAMPEPDAARTEQGWLDLFTSLGGNENKIFYDRTVVEYSIRWSQVGKRCDIRSAFFNISVNSGEVLNRYECGGVVHRERGGVILEYPAVAFLDKYMGKMITRGDIYNILLDILFFAY